jgi:hypothetical protein
MIKKIIAIVLKITMIDANRTGRFDKKGVRSPSGTGTLRLIEQE